MRTLCCTERTHTSTLDGMRCQVILTPPSICTHVLAGTEINSTHGKKLRKYCKCVLCPSLSHQAFSCFHRQRIVLLHSVLWQSVSFSHECPWDTHRPGVTTSWSALALALTTLLKGRQLAAAKIPSASSYSQDSQENIAQRHSPESNQWFSKITVCTIW